MKQVPQTPSTQNNPTPSTQTFITLSCGLPVKKQPASLHHSNHTLIPTTALGIWKASVLNQKTISHHLSLSPQPSPCRVVVVVPLHRWHWWWAQFSVYTALTACYASCSEWTRSESLAWSLIPASQHIPYGFGKNTDAATHSPYLTDLVKTQIQQHTLQTSKTLPAKSKF